MRLIRRSLRPFGPVALIVLASAMSTVAQQPANQDDAAVYDEVIEHTLRDSFQRYDAAPPGAPPATVYVVGRTIPTCYVPRDVSLGCVEQSDFGLTLPYAQGVDRIPSDRLPSATARAELTANFRTRNDTHHDLPLLHTERVKVLTEAERREAQQRVRNGERSNYAVFSLPAYSTDGHAVVYVAYVCGNVCGNWWLFLLERVEAKWQVQGRLLLGIA